MSEALDAQLRRALMALRETRRRLREALAENEALRSELLAAGEMIDDLAAELDRATNPPES